MQVQLPAQLPVRRTWTEATYEDGRGTDERSDALLTTISGWNSSMSYQKQVAAACAHLNIKPPSAIITRTRNPLVHNGMLNANLIEDHKALTNYDDEVHQAVQIMILAILGYSGYTFVPGKRECSMKEFLAE